MAAAATKIAIVSISLLLISLIVVVVYLSPINQTYNLLAVSKFSRLTLISRSFQQQDQDATVAHNIKKCDIRVARIEQQLAKARGQIHNAILRKRLFAPTDHQNKNGSNFIPQAKTTYRNPYAFFQSHTEMMKTFKVWTYKEGDLPLVHQGPLKSIYSVEGHFMDQMERKGNPLVANHPDEAHAFFIPISVANIVHYLYTVTEITNFLERIHDIFEDYIEVISQKYPYWNRTNGADHFYVSCHDWGPYASLRKNTKLFENVIRVLCNANTSEGFVPMRDVSMTEINGPFNNIPSVSSGQSPYNRSIFAFFAGGNHGFVRNKLFQYWGHKEDNDIQVYDYLPKGQNYTELLSQSKYCLCPSGYEVASARATEAIYVGCIPIIIKNNYVLPYSDVLDWSQFSVQVPVDKILDLKKILEEISFSKYLEMQKKVIEVQRHFSVNYPAKEFDVFHMILHSVWLRRLNVLL